MSFGFDVSFFWSRDSGVWFLIADFRFRISGFRFWVPGFVFQVSGFGLSFGLTSPHRAKQRAAPKWRHRRATFCRVGVSNTRASVFDSGKSVLDTGVGVSDAGVGVSSDTGVSVLDTGLTSPHRARQRAAP